MGGLFHAGGYPRMKTSTSLPSGYTKLAYIQSSGTQYINTGLYATKNTKVVAEAELLATNNYPMLCGAYNSSSSQFALFYNGGKWNAWFGTATATITDSYSGKRTFSMDSSAMVVGSNSVAISSGSFTTTEQIAIFAMNQDNTQYYHSSMKLYSMQFYENGTLVRDFVPCINSDGSIGMYDNVNRKFYGNSGTGSFIGSEVA